MLVSFVSDGEFDNGDEMGIKLMLLGVSLIESGLGLLLGFELEFEAVLESDLIALLFESDFLAFIGVHHVNIYRGMSMISAQ